MKSLLFFGLSNLAVCTVAKAAVGDKFLSYQENYPKSPNWYEFTVDTRCKENQEAISIQEFTSEKKYQGKSVRIVHIYASASNQNCKDLITEKKSRKVVIPVDAKRTTHVFVTYDSQLVMTSGH